MCTDSMVLNACRGCVKGMRCVLTLGVVWSVCNIIALGVHWIKVWFGVHVVCLYERYLGCGLKCVCSTLEEDVICSELKRYLKCLWYNWWIWEEHWMEVWFVMCVVWLYVRDEMCTKSGVVWNMCVVRLFDGYEMYTDFRYGLKCMYYGCMTRWEMHRLEVPYGLRCVVWLYEGYAVCTDLRYGLKRSSCMVVRKLGDVCWHKV